MYVCLYEGMLHICVDAQGGQKKGSDSPGDGVRGDCGPPDIGVRNPG